MPNYGVQKSSIAAVLSWYNTQPETRFAIYRGNKANDAYLTGGFYGNDKDEGALVLEQTLNEIETNDFNVYFLKLLPDNVKAKQATPGVTFQLYSNQISNNQISGHNASNAALHEVLNEIRAMRAERLQEMETIDDDDDDDDDENILAGFVKSPQMQQMLLNVLAGMFSNKPGNVQAVAGIETDKAELTKHLELLFSKGVTVDDIAKLAAMEQNQINFLLSMLRK